MHKVNFSVSGSMENPIFTICWLRTLCTLLTYSQKRNIRRLYIQNKTYGPLSAELQCHSSADHSPHFYCHKTSNLNTYRAGNAADLLEALQSNRLHVCACHESVIINNFCFNKADTNLQEGNQNYSRLLIVLYICCKCYHSWWNTLNLWISTLTS